MTSFYEQHPVASVDFYMKRLADEWAVKSAEGVSAHIIIPAVLADRSAATVIRKRNRPGSPERREATILLSWQSVLLASQYTKLGDIGNARRYANDAIIYGYQADNKESVGQGYAQMGIAEFWYGDARKGRDAAFTGFNATSGKVTPNTAAMLQTELMCCAAKLGKTVEARGAEIALLDLRDKLVPGSKPSVFNRDPDQTYNSRAMAHELLGSRDAVPLYQRGIQALRLNRGPTGFLRLARFNVIRALAPRDPSTAVSEATRMLAALGASGHRIDKVYRDRAGMVLKAVPASFPEARTVELRALVVGTV